jgi:hypothetical protein
MSVYFITIRNRLRPVGVFYCCLVQFVVIWYIFPVPIGVFYGRLVQFVVIWYIFTVSVCLDQEKYGNPAVPSSACTPKKLGTTGFR